MVILLYFVHITVFGHKKRAKKIKRNFSYYGAELQSSSILRILPQDFQPTSALFCIPGASPATSL